MRHTKMYILWVLALLTFLVGPSTSAAAVTTLHWKRSPHPVVVTLYDQTGDPLWRDAIQRLSGEWNAGIEGVEFVYRVSTTNADCTTGRGAFTVVACIRENSNVNHVAEAHLYSDGEHLVHAMIWMDPRSDPSRNHLACHELGHTLGVVHRNPEENNTCMIDGYVERVEHPDQKDFDGVTRQHSHTH